MELSPYGIIGLLFLVFTSNAQAQLFQEGFHSPGSFAAGGSFGDLNGDGHIDFVVGFNAHAAPNPLNATKIWINNGDSTFSLYDSIGTDQCGDIEIADIDMDGDLDIIAGNTDVASNSRVWLNDGNANFTQGQSLGFEETGAVVVADFNEDGYPDVFLGTYEVAANDRLYINQGNGQLSLVSIPWTTGAVTSDAEAKDIDSDGHMDIIICRGNAPLDSRRENEVWLGYGDGTFFKSPQIFPFVSSWAMAVGDYNGDGYVDVIFKDGDNVHGYLNDGTTLFNANELIYNEISATDVDLIDIDYDGDLDLIIARFAGVDNYESLVLFNDGAGNFTDGSETFSTADTWRMECVDIDLDNDMDLLTINLNNNDNVFWINQTDPVLSVPNTSPSHLSLFPNPTSQYINIEGENLASITHIEIVDALGHAILLNNKVDTYRTLDVSKLSSGVYFCKITTKQGASSTLKFIKQ